MTWNHRVIKSIYDVVGQPDEISYAVHEVYYDEDGKPTSYTKEPVFPCGDTLEELQQEIERFAEAARNPVLTDADFAKATQQP
jgi:hypothetical protein